MARLRGERRLAKFVAQMASLIFAKSSGSSNQLKQPRRIAGSPPRKTMARSAIHPEVFRVTATRAY
jgi:hypothetical protein